MKVQDFHKEALSRIRKRLFSSKKTALNPSEEALSLYDEILQFVADKLSHSITDPSMIADELTGLMVNFGRDIEPLAGLAGEMTPEESLKYWSDKGYE